MTTVSDVLELIPYAALNEASQTLSTTAIERQIDDRKSELQGKLNALGLGPIDPQGSPYTCRDWLLDEMVLSKVVGDVLSTLYVAGQPEEQALVRWFGRKTMYLDDLLGTPRRTGRLKYAFITTELGALPTTALATIADVDALTGLVTETGSKPGTPAMTKVILRATAVARTLLAYRFGTSALSDDLTVFANQLVTKMAGAVLMRARSNLYAQALFDPEANRLLTEAMKLIDELNSGEADFLTLVA